MSDEIEHGSDELNTPSVEQTEQVQAAEGGEQSEGTLNQGGIRVGKQTFKDHNELAKAYGEAQRKITEMGQSRSEETKAWGWMLNWMKQTKANDPELWQQFQHTIAGKKLTPANVANAAQAAQAQQRQEPERDDSKFTDFDMRLARTEAELESEKFLRSHPELSAQEYAKVVKHVIGWEEAGKTGRTLEEGYRDLYFSDFANKAKAQGQKAAESAQKKGASASSLGASATSAQTKVDDKKRYWKMSEQEKSDHLLAKMKEQNVVHGEDD